MKDLTEYLVKFLVDKPEAVKVTEVISERSIIIEVSVAEEDIGRVIGKQGKTIGAIRIVLNAAAAKMKKRVVLELMD
ncbi:KH domain-containing protein [Candidatus Desantisbacteria bacterium]|nr:KH domain-containing protein [Candidatus Desantisbacteria bacterium]